MKWKKDKREASKGMGKKVINNETVSCFMFHIIEILVNFAVNASVFEWILYTGRDIEKTEHFIEIIATAAVATITTVTWWWWWIQDKEYILNCTRWWWEKKGKVKTKFG